jgi:alkylation response protein AidB-like acyl-CoA dehydrogenase
MPEFRFPLRDLPPETEVLRREVREFLAEELHDFPARKRAFTWSGFDLDFSRKVAKRGWIGMTLPRRYGGGERSAFERYVVLEEMLTAGAPVGAHWIGDRQSGPLLLRYGTEEQKLDFLPRLCRGEIFFCIGMSEPDSGSDLASIRARATKTDGGWLINGTKLWTTGAHVVEFMIALFRTEVVADRKHDGLSQFIVDLKSDGITVRTIRDLAGNEHFCEVVFENTFVPDAALVGVPGGGWSQVTAELAYERSGPERYLSCFPLLIELIREMPDPPDDRQAVAIGRQVAHLATLRQMSISVAGMLDEGENPALEASVVKDLGGVFEQALPGVAQTLTAAQPRVTADASDFQNVLAHLLQNAPSFSLRGGTREILRGIIARGLGLR